MSTTRRKIKRWIARHLRQAASTIDLYVPDAIERLVKLLRRWADRLNPPRTITFPVARIWASATDPTNFKLMAGDGVPAGDEGVDWVPVGGVRAAQFSFHDNLREAFGGGEDPR